MENTIQIVVLIGYLLVILGLGAMASRKIKGSEDMMVSGRKMGLFYVGMAIAAEYVGGLGTVGCAERAFNQGMGVIWYHISAGMGILVFGLFFSHYYRKYGIQTIPEYLYYLYDTRNWKANALLNIVAYSCFLVITNTALGSITASITGLPLRWMALASGIFITFYVLLAGMWSIAYTSILYMGTIYIGLPLAFFWMLHFNVPHLPGSDGLGGFAGLAQAMTAQGMDPSHWFSPFSLGAPTIIGFLVGGILAVPAAQATVNFSFGARNWKIARLAPFLAALLVIPVSVWTGTAGIYAKVAHLTEVPKLSLGASLMSINPWIGALATAGIFAAIISTAAAILFAVSGIFAKDILNRWMHPDADDRTQLTWTRYSILGFGLVSSLVAMTLPEILRSAYFVYSLRSVTFIVILFGIYWRRSHPDAAFWTMIAGFAAAVAYMFTPIGQILNLHVAVFTTLVAMPVFVVMSLIKKWTPNTAAELPPTQPQRG